MSILYLVAFVDAKTGYDELKIQNRHYAHTRARARARPHRRKHTHTNTIDNSYLGHYHIITAVHDNHVEHVFRLRVFL